MKRGTVNLPLRFLVKHTTLCCCSLDLLKLRDDLIKQSLTEKQQILAALYQKVMEQETPHKGLLLRGDASDLQQGETLLKEAIDEGKN